MPNDLKACLRLASPPKPAQAASNVVMVDNYAGQIACEVVPRAGWAARNNERFAAMRLTANNAPARAGGRAAPVPARAEAPTLASLMATFTLSKSNDPQAARLDVANLVWAKQTLMQSSGMSAQTATLDSLITDRSLVAAGAATEYESTLTAAQTLWAKVMTYPDPARSLDPQVVRFGQRTSSSPKRPRASCWGPSVKRLALDPSIADP